MTEVQEYITLKWGTLKGWRIRPGRLEMARLVELRLPVGMGRHLSDEQRIALCDLIDVVDGPVDNDWSGEKLSKEAAKAYVMDYGKEHK